MQCGNSMQDCILKEANAIHFLFLRQRTATLTVALNFQLIQLKRIHLVSPLSPRDSCVQLFPPSNLSIRVLQLHL